MTAATLELVRSIGYVNAGTAEFLLGPDEDFYFLEVNARIQVEHPVTELCTGVDLVQEQFRVAAGLPLSFTQEEIVLRGVAIECRISAEDPENRFLPATGTIVSLQESAGPGVRVESSLYPGLRVPLFYDPLLAKLVVWGRGREQAIARMRRALAEYQIVGVRTTLSFARWLMEQPRFVAGDLSTDFIAEEWDQRDFDRGGQAQRAVPTALRQERTVTGEQVAAIVGGLLFHEQVEQQRQASTATDDGTDGNSRWRDASRREILQHY
jgi:acetyl/propionyl-CoA carboxylase alpha subunit